MSQPLHPATRAREGFLGQLFAGKLRWDLVRAFPEQDPEERQAGDAVVAEVERFLKEHVDADEVERAGRLSPELIEALRSRGYYKLPVERELGGRGLSLLNTFRVIEAVMSRCLPVGYTLAIHSGLGAGAIIEAVQAGPLKDYVRGRVADGAISGWADTEPTGASARRASTTATPTADGTAYVLNGEKVYIGNGSIADLLNVTATLCEDGREQISLFFVETTSPGFRVRAEHGLMGLRGLPIAALSFDNVRVPKERMLAMAQEHWRNTPLLEPLSALGRMYIIVAASLALSKQCLLWSRDFLHRRLAQGRVLGDFEEIQRQVSATAAEVFALESVARWSLTGVTVDTLPVRWFEQVAAKNIASLACARIADRTLSLLAAEGYETAASKAARGAVPVPLERVLRDARAFRVAGGVDFLVDHKAAREGLFSLYYPSPAQAAELESPPAPLPVEEHLSARNREHLQHTAREVHRLARKCQELSRRYPDAGVLYARQRTLILLNQVCNELFTQSVTLAHAAALAARGQPHAGDLADVYCTAASYRLEDLWRQLDAEAEPDFAGVSARWLSGSELDFLLCDVLTRP
ncbi:acyl-CoA dehydrogenase family protein [Corallococcus llansteffanensis]|uniref:Acyl-CoA dehydrogenase n=1 Tax=Corallococcus llansteffanensis TaxID=2316731 RepID=A0A3A8PSQ2_9BACT|nr:acyl-CoA dehydrogenase family protein [Corallococcus llansteffanensis]RKH58080.1 acyl-CoA dehydrogenase [Corallococcus llansteffanensis]